jgi:collagenase-like PrtC family protease
VYYFLWWKSSIATPLPHSSVIATLGDPDKHDEIQYLLSPQDLCGLEQVEGLVRVGVSCLKIEGRLKDASYVAATAYQQAIDAVWDKLMKEHEGTENSSSRLPRRRILSSPNESVSQSDF